jgi:hypothetical protein
MRKTMVCAAALAAAVLVAGVGVADAPAAAVSNEAAVDTRTRCAALLAEDAGLDSRGFTAELSDGIRLNTKKIVGTMIMVR